MLFNYHINKYLSIWVMEFLGINHIFNEINLRLSSLISKIYLLYKKALRKNFLIKEIEIILWKLLTYFIGIIMLIYKFNIKYCIFYIIISLFSLLGSFLYILILYNFIYLLYIFFFSVLADYIIIEESHKTEVFDAFNIVKSPNFLFSSVTFAPFYVRLLSSYFCFRCTV